MRYNLNLRWMEKKDQEYLEYQYSKLQDPKPAQNFDEYKRQNICQTLVLLRLASSVSPFKDYVMGTDFVDVVRLLEKQADLKMNGVEVQWVMISGEQKKAIDFLLKECMETGKMLGDRLLLYVDIKRDVDGCEEVLEEVEPAKKQTVKE